MRRASPAVTSTHDAAGVLEARNDDALGAYPPTLVACLERFARERPGHAFLAERGTAGTWDALDYASALARVRAISLALRARDLSGERPIAILAPNGIAHALLGLAAFDAGIPYVPISPAYAAGPTFARLAGVVRLVRPGLVLVPSARAFAVARLAAFDAATEIVTIDDDAFDRATPFAELAAARTSSHEPHASAATADGIAKILLTSGTTGEPKGVLTTHRMLCANQQMFAQLFPCVRDVPPVLVEWLPWSHTFGGSQNVGIALYNGGTLYVSRGRPAPANFTTTVEDLMEIPPTLYFDVPRGFASLARALRASSAFRARFFSRLDVLFTAAAPLPHDLWHELHALAAECGRDVLVTSGFGATETAPLALAMPVPAGDPACVGIPAPGVAMALVPRDGRYELRVRGPNVTPGYYRDPAATAAAFDERGYYRTGDALRALDARDGSRGFAFEGRFDDDFKTPDGAWVRVGALRAALLAELRPLASDVAIAGEGRERLGALVVLDDAACEGLGPAAIRMTLARGLRAFADRATGSARALTRIVPLREPLAFDAGEATDKGTTAVRRLLARRRDVVDALFADAPPPEVIALDAPHVGIAPSGVNESINPT